MQLIQSTLFARYRQRQSGSLTGLRHNNLIPRAVPSFGMVGRCPPVAHAASFGAESSSTFIIELHYYYSTAFATNTSRPRPPATSLLRPPAHISQRVPAPCCSSRAVLHTRGRRAGAVSYRGTRRPPRAAAVRPGASARCAPRCPPSAPSSRGCRGG